MITTTITPNDITSYIENGDVVITLGQEVTLDFTSTLGSITEILSNIDLPDGLSIVDNTIVGTPTTKQAFTDIVLSFSTGEEITISIAVIGAFDFRKLKSKEWNFYNYHKTENAIITISNTLENSGFSEIQFVIPPLTVLKFTFSKDGIYKAFVQCDGSEFYHVIYEFSDVEECYSNKVRKFFTDCNCSEKNKNMRLYEINKLMALKQTFSYLLNPLFNQKLLYSTNVLLEADLPKFINAMDLHTKIGKLCATDCCDCNC